MMRRFCVLVYLLLIAFPCFGSGYTETFYEWTHTGAASSWAEVDLSSYVAANSVTEIICFNSADEADHYVGVRNTSSSLARYLWIHEAEGGGYNFYRVHVNVDGDGKIDTYADATSDCGFVVVGYWDTGTYVELAPEYENVDTQAEWVGLTLSSCEPSVIAEVTIVMQSTNNPYTGGLRATGSSLERKWELHEAEPNGGPNKGDNLTIFVELDGDTACEAYDDTQYHIIVFAPLGYWSDPPGTWTEKMYEVPDASADDTWEDEDLTGQATDGAVLEWVMMNDRATSIYLDGVHTNGSGINRYLVMDEAEQSGQNGWSCHVLSDGDGIVEMYQDDYSYTTHYLTGQWVTAAPTYRRRVIIAE